MLQVKKFTKKKWRAALSAISLTLALLLCGCGRSEDATDERTEVDFTVVAPDKLPPELQTIIEENKKEEMRLTYEDGAELYLIRGYGEQKTGGYSIAVSGCAEDENGVWFDTRLIGPPDVQTGGKEPSYPYIVVKIERRDKDVMIG